MILNRLKIDNLRNITKADIDCSAGINLITGDNGAGKTTLLEAIYLLSRNRSFRTGIQAIPIQRGKDSLLIFAKFEGDSSNEVRVGYSRTKTTTDIRLNGSQVKRLSEIAKSIPLILITPQSHRLIEEGPENRRRVFNWGVFHVEHNYRDVIANFHRSLAQRNSALKRGESDISVWNRAFIENALALKKVQTDYFEKWKRIFEAMTKEIPFLQEMETRYYSGWNEKGSLSELIESNIVKDKERGFTTVGPHRADIHFTLDGSSSKQTLSRGQQKVLILTIFLAQARTLEDETGNKPIFLFDDIDSELDEKTYQLVLGLLKRQRCQLFMTSINKSRPDLNDWHGGSRVFHVEHGSFSSR